MIYFILLLLAYFIYPNLFSIALDGYQVNHAFLGALLGGVGSLAGSLWGSHQAAQASKRAAEKEAQARAAAMREIAGMRGLQLPTYDYTPQLLDEITGYDPIQYMDPGDVKANLVEDSPELRAMQLQALESIQQRADEGLSAADKYNFMKSRRNAEMAARGREGAIMNNMQARGMGGSGIEAAMRMMGSQSEMDRLAESQALQAASNADMRSKATQLAGQMSGQMRMQDISRNQSNADILNQLAWNNSQRKMEIANRNVDMQNQALQDKINERRRVSTANANLMNQRNMDYARNEIERSRALQNSAREKAQLMAGAKLGSIEGIRAQGAADSSRAQNLWSNLGQIPGAAIGAYNAYQNQQADKAYRQKRDLLDDKFRNQLLNAYKGGSYA